MCLPPAPDAGSDRASPSPNDACWPEAEAVAPAAGRSRAGVAPSPRMSSPADVARDGCVAASTGSSARAFCGAVGTTTAAAWAGCAPPSMVADSIATPPPTAATVAATAAAPLSAAGPAVSFATMAARLPPPTAAEPATAPPLAPAANPGSASPSRSASAADGISERATTSCGRSARRTARHDRQRTRCARVARSMEPSASASQVRTHPAAPVSSAPPSTRISSRRARLSSASTADTDVPSEMATSAVDSPSHSRSTYASRCDVGSRPSAWRAACRSERSSTVRGTEGAGADTSPTRSSSSDADSGRRMPAAMRARHSLRAILSTHACGSRTGVEPVRAVCTERKVACVASSASSREPSMCHA